MVLTVTEVRQVLGFLGGIHRLMGLLLYGGGLRLTECLSLRVKDVDLERRELLVRRGKAGKIASPCCPSGRGPGWWPSSGRPSCCMSVRWRRAKGEWSSPTEEA